MRVVVVLPVFLLLLYFCLFIFDAKIRPAILFTSKAAATRVATEVLNGAVTESLAKEMDETPLVKIVQDDREDGTSIARFNFGTITYLQSQAVARAENQFQALSKQRLLIPISSVISGSYFLNPNWSLPVRMVMTGTVHSAIRPEVKTVGVNQSVHIVYIDLTADINIIGPFISSPLRVRTEVPVAYIVMSGNVPQAIYNGNNSGVTPLLPRRP